MKKWTLDNLNQSLNLENSDTVVEATRGTIFIEVSSLVVAPGIG